MAEIAYVFERFPSFGQTFCYREVAELIRQGVDLQIFSIRRPDDGPQERWDPAIVGRVEYLPAEKELVTEVDRVLHRKEVPTTAGRAVAGWGRKTDFLRLYQAIYIGRRLGPDVKRVHAHFAGMAARTVWWLREFFGVRFSFTAHANDIFAPREFAIGLDKLVGDAAGVVTVSDYSADFLRQRFPQSAPRIHRVYNGIDMAQFRRAHFAGDLPLIIAVGRLITKKGFRTLIAGCARLAEKYAFRCEIIGDGPLERELQQQIAELELANVVKLSGAQSQQAIVERLEAARVFALPCTTDADGGMDNLPTVIMEAMAAGLPVVSTSVAGVPEMVRDGETGLLVRPDDPDALAQALAQFVADGRLARRVGDAGLQRASQLFAIEKTTAELAALLRS